MKNSIKLNKTIIDKYSPPYIIAEIGVNHEGSINKAKELIEQASIGGANAVKFQTYKAEKLTVKNSPYYWSLKDEPTKTQFELFKKYDAFKIQDYYDLAEYSKKNNIEFISTIFDLDTVDEMDQILSYYKISSSDITNIPLLRKIASKKKPLIISTGASNLEDIKNAIKIVKQLENKINFSLLHCVLNYPTKDFNANLGFIKVLEEEFKDTIIGYSDHTLPDPNMTVCSCAYLLGARIIEKHFTDDKNKKGNDHYHSMDKEDLKNLIFKIDKYRKILGSNKKKIILDNENIAANNARRSIYTKTKLKKGDILSDKNIIAKRPINGIEVSRWDFVLGKKLKCDLDMDTPITESILEK